MYIYLFIYITRILGPPQAGPDVILAVPREVLSTKSAAPLELTNTNEAGRLEFIYTT